MLSSSFESPGPGSYIELASVEQVKRGKKCPFGTGLDRFKQTKAAQIPGPGQYRPEISQKLLDRRNLTDGTSCFKTKTKRSLEMKTQEEDCPGVGQYSPERYNQMGNLGRSQELSNQGKFNQKLINLQRSSTHIPIARNQSQSTLNSPNGSPQKTPQKVLQGIIESFIGPGTYEASDNYITKLRKHEAA